ncbi:MAG: serine hydrolase [Oscillospiraceae bacterium]
MQLLTHVKALTFIKKLLLNDTEHILPFTPMPQKGECPAYLGERLPRSTPELEGVNSGVIDAFLRELAADDTAGIHSVMIARHGKVICEAGFAPYSTKKWHVTHSLCKTFTGTAIGMLVSDGVITIDEKICDIFPEKCSFLTSKRMRSVTIEHLLTMTSGVNFREIGAVLEKDWVRAFMESDISFEPGTEMDYNSMNSYMLSAIISRKTGNTLAEFLNERLFKPLGFGACTWETCPMGITKGGWGMYLFLEDALKLGQLYLQKGYWNVNGKEIAVLDKSWVLAATAQHALRNNDEEYGYQLWPNSAQNYYMFNGMFGQYVVVFPTSELIVAINAGNGHLFTKSFALDTICRHFVLSALNISPCEKDDASAKKLRFTLDNLKFGEPVPEYIDVKSHWYDNLFKIFKKPQPLPIITLPIQAKMLYNKKLLFENRANGILPIILQVMCDSYGKGINSIEFAEENAHFIMKWSEGGETLNIPLGFTDYEKSIIKINGTSWHIAAKAEFKKDEDDCNVLKIRCCFLESSSSRLIKLVLTDSGAILKMDETPAVALAMEKLSQEQALIRSTDAFFKDFDYIEYKVNKICTPVLRGVFENGAI